MLFSAASRSRVLSLLLLASVAFLGSCKKKTPEERYTEAQQLFQEKQVPLAMIKLRDLIAEEPESDAAIEARFALAQINMQLGRPDNFAKALEQTDAIFAKLGFKDNRGFQAYAMKTDILLAQGEVDKALEHLRSGVEKSADTPDAQQRLQSMYAGLQLAGKDDKLQEEGVAFFRKTMLESDKADQRGQSREVLAEHFRGKKEFAKSNEVYQTYIDKYPSEAVIPQLVMAQALNLKALGDKEAADVRFKEGSTKMLAQVDQELNLNSRMSLLNDLAKLTEVYGDLEGAEGLFRRIMTDQPRTLTAIQAQMAIGDMYARHQQWDKATALFEQMKRENPQSEVGQKADQYLKAIAARIKDAETSGTTTAQPGAAPKPAGT